MLDTFTQQLAGSQSLSDEQIRVAVEELTSEGVPAATKADFLIALAQKGETAEEIAAFARTMLAKAVIPELPAQIRTGEILDVVGTGGDRLGTFNISTSAAIICAAAGVRVAKHGNRGATSQCGSADVLEALGVPIDLAPDQAAGSLLDLGFAFFFAPKYHPAFKQVAAARRLCAERGQRTIFNFLGPLLNPARPSAMLVGVPRPELCEPLARVLQTLGVRRAMVVCGKVHGLKSKVQSLKSKVQGPEAESQSPKSEVQSSAGTLYLDELSILGENAVAEFYQENGFHASVLTTEQFPLQPATLEDLLGGDREANAQIVTQLLAGEERGPKLDAVLLNAAAGLMVAGQARSLASGWDMAAATIDNGQALLKLKALIAG